MTEPKLEEVKFGKFWMTAKARRIIYKIIDHRDFGTYSGIWLVRDGRVQRRSSTTDDVVRMPSRLLDKSEVHLGFGFLDNSPKVPRKTPFFSRVPYRASRQEIEDGWMEIAWKLYMAEARELAQLIAAQNKRNERDMRAMIRLLRDSMDPCTRDIANRLMRELRASA